LTGMRDTATACCVLRDDFREALINSKIFRFAVGFCAYGMHACKDATILCVYSGEALSTRLMAVKNAM